MAKPGTPVELTARAEANETSDSVDHAPVANDDARVDEGHQEVTSSAAAADSRVKTSAHDDEPAAVPTDDDALGETTSTGSAPAAHAQRDDEQRPQGPADGPRVMPEEADAEPAAEDRAEEARSSDRGAASERDEVDDAAVDARAVDVERVEGAVADDAAAHAAHSSGSRSVDTVTGGAARAPRTGRGRRTPRAPRVTTPQRELGEPVLTFSNVTKRYGTTIAVDDISLEVRAGSFFGVVGPNGSGKTTLLSMATGMVRPSSGTIEVHNIDVWRKPVDAKRQLGVLPDRLRLFDQLTGAQMLHYAGLLHGLGDEAARDRAKDLIEAFDLHDAASRLVADYSTGMTKKVALAAALLHAPRALILDEPFEAVDPVSTAALEKILEKYVESGGTVVLSSHSMELVQRLCDQVAIIVRGRMLAYGPVDEVRGRGTLEQKFYELAGGRQLTEGMEWLSSFSD